ncbi:MAG: RNA 2',3'-cyclic phosphodiesterase [Chloroflexota bacterium]|nr:RNA 2',3'-cyclic phosphodiesterase [Chloroflexota bacterium]
MNTVPLVRPLRTFVAVELPPTVRVALGTLQAALATAALPLRLAAPASLHLTLAFIGDIPAARLADLTAVVRGGCAGISPFVLWAAGLGMFPHERAPRVVWAGVDGDSAALATLQQLHAAIHTALAAADFPADREFHFAPHLTLARVRDGSVSAECARIGPAVQGLTLAPVPFPVAAVRIMRSDLRPSGPVYTPLDHVSLTGGVA